METTTTPQKVLFVITKSNWGGAQKYVFDLATELQKRGINSMVAAGGYGEMLERLEYAGVPIIHLTRMKNNMNPLTSIGAFFELVSLFKKEKPDVVHINSSKAGLFGTLAARFASVPHIIFTAHAWPFNEERASWQRFILKKLMQVTVFLSHKTICVSQKTLNDLSRGKLARKCVVVHNGIRPLHLEPGTSFYETFHIIRKEKVAIVSIGELHKSKGFDLALSYLQDLTDLSWEWFILGEGKERQNLERQIKDLKLTSRVHLIGHVKDAAQYLEAFDLFFLPSRTEALAYVAIEALQSDLPIIASDVGGIPEVLGRDPGTTLVDIRNEKTIEIMRDNLLTYPAKITSGRDDLRKEFSLERMIDKTIEVYRK